MSAGQGGLPTLDGVAPPATLLVLSEVLEERAFQQRKFGSQSAANAQREPESNLSILIEEVGEAAHELNEWRFIERGDMDDAQLTSAREERLRRARNELVQVAATAVAMVESIDARRAASGAAS